MKTCDSCARLNGENRYCSCIAGMILCDREATVAFVCPPGFGCTLHVDIEKVGGEPAYLKKLKEEEDRPFNIIHEEETVEPPETE